MLTEFLLYIGSIGLSDAIELYLNPTVHRIHNAPDLSGKPWAQYTYFDALWTGIKCSWIMIIPFSLFLVLNVRFYGIYPMVLINLLTPIFSYLFGWQEHDPFMSHKILYAVGFIYFYTLTAITVWHPRLSTR